MKATKAIRMPKRRAVRQPLRRTGLRPFRLKISRHASTETVSVNKKISRERAALSIRIPPSGLWTPASVCETQAQLRTPPQLLQACDCCFLIVASRVTAAVAVRTGR